MAAARLKALLHATKDAQQSAQQRNNVLLHVAHPRECNTQHLGTQSQETEVRRLVEVIAKAAPAYWTAEDIEEAVWIARRDLDNALTTFRTLAEQYGARLH